METWQTYASLYFWLHVAACRTGSAFGVLSGHYWASFSCKDRASCWQRCCRSSFKHQEGCRWRKRNLAVRLVWHVGPGKSGRFGEADVSRIVRRGFYVDYQHAAKTYIEVFLAFPSISQNHFRILKVGCEDLDANLLKYSFSIIQAVDSNPLCPLDCNVM